jgi:predicted transcriptional regulator
MASTTIRVPEPTRETLRELSRQSGEPISVLVAKAVERLRREYFLKATNQAFASLHEDPEAWQDELAERAEWEQTLSDGQDEE